MLELDTARVVWYNPEPGVMSRGDTIAIVTDGRTTLHAIIADTPVRFARVPKEHARRMKPVLRKGHEYEVGRAARKTLAMGRRHGMSEAARKALVAIIEATKQKVAA